jgi:hypothetical protein
VDAFLESSHGIVEKLEDSASCEDVANDAGHISNSCLAGTTTQIQGGMLCEILGVLEFSVSFAIFRSSLTPEMKCHSSISISVI